MAHPNKHIQQAIDFAIANGWRFEKSKGGQAHPYGTLKCPLPNRDGHRFFVHSTPRSPETHAKQIIRAVRNCTHSTES